MDKIKDSETNYKIEMHDQRRDWLSSGVLSNDKTGSVIEGNFRRYLGDLQSRTKINYKSDTAIKSILYEIGKRDSGISNLIMVDPVHETGVSQSFEANSFMDEETTNLHKKITNFDGKFEYMDLSGIAYRLGMGIAKYNQTGKITVSELRAGKQLMLRALNTAFDPVTASANSVFIPRLSSTIMNPATFCALVACCNAYGSMVYSDVVELTGNYAVVIENFQHEQLVGGCFEGLRLLLNIGSLNNSGNLIVFAFLKGLHSYNTIVAHSDEGGFFRDVIRSGFFVPPYGGIYYSDSIAKAAIPMPSKFDRTSVCNVVDSYLLLSAAIVSLCDKGVFANGKYHSSTFSSSGTKYKDNKGEVQVRYDLTNLNLICSVVGPFFDNFSEIINRMFGTIGVSEKVSMFLQQNLRAIASPNAINRHLNFQTVSPFFWIEPTSLILNDISDFNITGPCKPIALVGREVEVNVIDNGKIYRDYGGKGLISFDFTSSRRTPLLIHLQNHQEDGLANIIPWLFNTDSVYLPGGLDTTGEKLERMAHIGDYHWGRGQSMIQHPAELGYIGNTMTAMFSFQSMNDTTFDLTVNHVPNINELLNGKIIFCANRPRRIKDGGISTFTKIIKKERNLALNALLKASQSSFIFGGINTEFIERGSYEVTVSREILETRVDIIENEPIDNEITENVKIETEVGRSSSVEIKTVDENVKPKTKAPTIIGQSGTGNKLKQFREEQKNDGEYNVSNSPSNVGISNVEEMLREFEKEKSSSSMISPGQ